MKKFKVMLSVFMVLLILSISISPAFAENQKSFESVKPENDVAQEDYQVLSEELGEGPYNNDEKILCTATIEDDFDDDSLLVVMKNEASLDFENFETPQFSEIQSKKVSEITSHKSEKIHSEFKTKKAEHTSELKKELESEVSKSQGVVSSNINNTLSKADNKIIEDKAAELSTTEIEEEYSDFHKIIHIELNTKDKQNVLDTIKELEKNEDVLAVCPNYTCIKQTKEANDTDLSAQWALENISVPSAWNITTGSDSVKVGIIDDGIDQSHPDLYDNYDDELSKSFTDAPPNVSVDGHGTAVAGIIGAVGNNNKGINGVCWNVKLVSLQEVSLDGEWKLFNLLSAIQYADEKSIPILNYSSTLACLSGTVAPLEVAINSYDGIFICSAGNNIANIDDDNPTTNSLYPSKLSSKKIISVAAINENNELCDFSNYGDESVDLAAPGEELYTTVNEDDKLYEKVQGTSYSAPYVTGVAALIKSKYPNISYLGIRKAILSGVDKVSTLSEKVSTGGKLNAYKALNNVGKIKYTIEYDANGGTGTAMADTQITYGFYTNLRDVTYTKPQHDFVGWEVYRASDNKYYYTNGSTKRWYTEGSQPTGYEKVVYANQTPIGHLSETNNEVITMVAKWKLFTYKIKLLWYATTDGYTEDIEANYNENITLPVCTYTRYGYTSLSGWKVYKNTPDLGKVWLYSDGVSKGWYAENTQPLGYNIVEYGDNSTFCNTDEITNGVILYFEAQWDPIRYNINYDSNGGVGVMDDTIGYTDMSVQLSNNTFIKTDYIFDGWYIVDSDGYWSSVYDDWDDTITLDEDKKLYNDGDSVVYTAEYSGVELTAIAQWLLLGDVDLDGVVSVMDATEIQRHFAHIITLTEKQIKCGDFNQDGYFDLSDATAIQQYVTSGNQ